MRRRDVIAGLAAMLIAPEQAPAQQTSPKIPRVGILSLAENEADKRWKAFREGLRDLGYIEGRNIILEYRFARGDFATLQQLTKEIASLPVDAIMVDGAASAQSAAAVIHRIPIVVGALGADPMELGLANSLARPGRNLTGFTIIAPELAVKRVDLVRTAFPDAATITVLLNPSKAGSEALFRLTQEAAHSLGLGIIRVEAANPEALHALTPELVGRGGAVLVLTDAMFWEHRREIVDLVAAVRVPALYPERDFVDDGGLMAYGPNVPDNFRRAADYVDRILKGAKPGDLPIQEPVRFDFVVNLKTAKELGLTIPPLILSRATGVME
jgi:putative tryptophan/tyrosine transport system substrate-binding protein